MKNRLDTEEEKTDEPKTQQKLLTMKQRKKTDKNKLGIDELWDNVKRPNIYATGILKKEERGRGEKRLSEEIMAKSF